MTSPTPARVSGPAALSQRTDGGQPIRHIADAKYGEDKAFVEQQKGAPLADGPDRPVLSNPQASSGPAGPVPPGGLGTAASREITPLSAPTAYPAQAVTTGMQTGPTPPRPPKPQMKPGQLSQALAPYVAADDTGVLAEFAWQLSEMGL